MKVSSGIIASRKGMPLDEQFPPSEPCSCNICRAYCMRPGWWTVREASKAMDAGLSSRMMLEISPEISFGVLSPASKGFEGKTAENVYSGCCFQKNGLCELFGTGYQPLECRYCHHARIGLGSQCHAALAQDWNTAAGQALVIQWICTVG